MRDFQRSKPLQIALTVRPLGDEQEDDAPVASCCGGVCGDFLAQGVVERVGYLLVFLGGAIRIERPEERGPVGRPEELFVIGGEGVGVAALLVLGPERVGQDDLGRRFEIQGRLSSVPKLVAPVGQEGPPVSFRLSGERFLYRAGRPFGPDVVGDGGGNAAEPVDRDRVPADVDVGSG
jgi:hypothetical protein